MPVDGAPMAVSVRRHPKDKRGRYAGTTLCIPLDAVVPSFESLRPGIAALGPPAAKVLTRMGRFAQVALDDIDLYAREKLGAVLGCPTDSGRRLDVALGIYGERHLVLFDPRCRVPWLTFEQLARVFRVSDPALRNLVMRVRKRAFINDDAIKVVIGKDRDGRRHSISHLRWQAVMMLAAFGHGDRVSMLRRFVDEVAIALDERRDLQPLYALESPPRK